MTNIIVNLHLFIEGENKHMLIANIWKARRIQSNTIISFHKDNTEDNDNSFLVELVDTL